MEVVLSRLFSTEHELLIASFPSAAPFGTSSKGAPRYLLATYTRVFSIERDWIIANQGFSETEFAGHAVGAKDALFRSELHYYALAELSFISRLIIESSTGCIYFVVDRSLNRE